jgi:hypothetical protein
MIGILRLILQLKYSIYEWDIEINCSSFSPPRPSKSFRAITDVTDTDYDSSCATT